MSLLSPLGIIRSADCGSAAVRLAMEERPQLIVSELALPDLDGTVLCATLRSDEYLRYPAILGVTRDADRVSPALDAGRDAVLMKPWDARSLILRATSLMLRRHSAAMREQSRDHLARAAHLVGRRLRSSTTAGTAGPPNSARTAAVATSCSSTSRSMRAVPGSCARAARGPGWATRAHQRATAVHPSTVTGTRARRRPSGSSSSPCVLFSAAARAGVLSSARCR